MPDQVIGTARIDITADPSGVEAATARAKASISSMSKDAQAQYQQLSAAEKRRVDALVRQADTVGMTRAQQIAYNASLKTSGPLLDELTKRLQVNETAAKKAGIEFNKYGLSAKMETAALRQVPAQITDIATSLQGGQRPLTVLLQQGGQLKDVFGGVVPAAKALGGAVVGMINPATLAIGALIGLAVAYQKGAEEAQAFNATLITTGNAIGVSVDGLQTLAKNVGAATTGQHDAAEVINQFAKAGKVASVNLADYAQVAIQWSQATGESTQSIVDNFTKLAKDPLKALVDLDDEMHFLTAAEYEHARALDETGSKTEQAQNAQQLYAAALADRTPKMVENLGLVEKAWRGIKNETMAGLNAILSIGRDQDLFQQLASAQGRLKTAQDSPGNSKAKQAGIAAQQAVVADLQERIRLQGILARGEQQANQDRISGVKLAEDRADFLKGGRTKSQQKDDAVAAEERKWKEVSADLESGSKEYEELYAAHRERLHQIDEKYKDKSGGPKNDAATRMLLSLKEQEASLRAQADSTEKLTSAQSALAKFEQQIADIKSKQTLTADEKSILAAQDKLRAQLQVNVAVEREAEAKKALILLDQRSAQIAQQMASSRQSTNEQYQRMLDSFGLGDKALVQVEAQRSIYREFKKYQDELTKIAAKSGTLDSDAYKEGSAAIQAELQRRLAMQKSYYDTVDQLQSSWSLGASHGLANYADESANAFKGMESLATKSFQGMEDAWVDFAMTGKASFSDLTNSVISDLMRITVRQQVLGPLAGALGKGLGSLFGSTALPSTASWALPAAPSANGNVFSGSGISAYENMIVDRPTFFASGGNVMGEAGPEAIMPLKRGPDGRLGVSAGGGSGAGDVTVNVINNSSQPVTAGQPKISMDSMGRMVIDVMISDLQRNGPYARQLKGAL